MTNVVVTDYIVTDLSYEHQRCKDLGVSFQNYELKSAGAEALIQAASKADVIVVNMAKLGKEVIDHLDSCKLIVRCGIGYDNVDTHAASQRGIQVVNIPDYCLQEVAEQTVMLIMACQRKITQQTALLRESSKAGKWISDPIKPIFRLSGKNVGILGFGGIGRAVYRMLQGFGVNFMICDPYLPPEKASEYGIFLVDFEQLIQNSDLVTIHIPVIPGKTYHLFDKPVFDQMKPNAILVNTSRGGIVNLDALDEALNCGKIAFAGIDVYEQEPPNMDLKILHNPKAICTPHISWVSEESVFMLRQKIFDNVQKYVKGEPLTHVVNSTELISFKDSK